MEFLINKIKNAGLVLITGATGFVGRAVCQQLLTQGYAVRAAVRQFSPVLASEVEQVVVGDFAAKIDWLPLLEKVTAVIHLAARVHVMRETARDPLSAFRAVNVVPTIQLARAAVNSGVKRFVFVSTIKVNGECTKDLPFTEQDKAAPQDAYAISKHEAEQELQAIARQTPLEVVIVRPPLVYGPGVGGNFVQLLKAIQKKIPLPLKNMRNRRSMIYVENLADALITCMLHPAAANQTFLVSDGEDVSIAELIELLSEYCHQPSRLFALPKWCLTLVGKLLRQSAAIERLTNALQVDNQKICRQLDWKIPHTLRAGLLATVKSFCLSCRGLTAVTKED